MHLCVACYTRIHTHKRGTEPIFVCMYRRANAFFVVVLIINYVSRARCVYVCLYCEHTSPYLLRTNSILKKESSVWRAKNGVGRNDCWRCEIEREKIDSLWTNQRNVILSLRRWIISLLLRFTHFSRRPSDADKIEIIIQWNFTFAMEMMFSHFMNHVAARAQFYRFLLREMKIQMNHCRTNPAICLAKKRSEILRSRVLCSCRN